MDLGQVRGGAPVRVPWRCRSEASFGPFRDSRPIYSRGAAGPFLPCGGPKGPVALRTKV